MMFGVGFPSVGRESLSGVGQIGSRCRDECGGWEGDYGGPLLH